MGAAVATRGNAWELSQRRGGTHGDCRSDSRERTGAVAVTRGNAWGLSQRRGGTHGSCRSDPGGMPAMTLKRGGLQKSYARTTQKSREKTTSYREGVKFAPCLLTLHFGARKINIFVAYGKNTRYSRNLRPARSRIQ